MRILDFMLQHGSTATEEPYGLYSGYFTVNNAVDYVSLVYADEPQPDYVYLLKNGSDKASFNVYDSFLLISMGIVLPSPFELFDPGCKISLTYSDDELNKIGLAGLSDVSGQIIVPFANYETPVGLMYSPNVLLGTEMKIGGMVTSIDGTALKISMLNIPDALNTAVFEVPIFAKFLHNDYLED